MMGIGYGPKIHLHGPMPKHSYMVPQPPTSSFGRIDSLQILFGTYCIFFLVSFVLVWEGTCIGFSLFDSCNVKCQEPLSDNV
jgi:hypothetical protein